MLPFLPVSFFQFSVEKPGMINEPKSSRDPHQTACLQPLDNRCSAFTHELSPVLFLQVFQTSSEKIESAGLAALTAITSCLSRSVLSSDSDDSLRTFLELILKGGTKST